MQNLLTHEAGEAHASPGLDSVSLGALAAIGLFALALVLRLIDLDLVPMTIREAPNALAALRAVWPATPGDPLTSSSAAVFLAQAVGFTAFGSGAFAARFLTAVVGAAVVLAPLLFRRRLGLSWAFAFSVALVFSPTLLLAARESAPESWALASAAAALWAFDRWRVGGRAAWAIAGSVAGIALALLTGWGGSVLAGILLGAAALARAWGRRMVRFDLPPLGGESAPWWRAFPWAGALGYSALAVGLLATVFMLYPAGLNAVAAAIGDLAGRFAPLGGEAPASPLGTTLFYETTVWLLAIAAVIYLLRRDLVGAVERFLIAWLALGVIAALLFAAGPAQSLWIAPPLAGLVSRLLVDLLRTDDQPGSWVPGWARWVCALVTLALLLIFSMAFQSFARALAQAPGGELAAAPLDPASLILMAVMLLFAVIVAVLGVNLWNRRTVLLGVGLAIAAFGGVASLGAGWHAAVPNAGDPAEPWHFTASDFGAQSLTQTLEELQDRLSRGLTTMPLTVQAAPDGLLAWLVRDYPNAVFVRDAREAVGAQVFLSEALALPELGGAYVGQDFTLTRTWTARGLALTELPAWWAQRLVMPRARDTVLPATATIWVRQDVYDGTDANARG